MLTKDQLLSKVLSDKNLFNIFNNHVFFYGTSFQSFLLKKLKEKKIYTSLNAIEEVYENQFKVRYLINIEELSLKIYYKPGLKERIENSEEITWDLVKDLQKIVPSFLITPYHIKDIKTYIIKGYLK